MRNHYRSIWLPALAAALVAAFVMPAAAQFPGRPQRAKGPWMDKTLSPDKRADLLVGQMTLDEKISLVHGSGWRFGPPEFQPPSHSLGGAGFDPGIPRLGIPDLQLSDAAAGVAKGDEFGRYSTPLPSDIAEAASWDVKVASEYGALIGRELRDQGFNMSLGGGVDLTREPRNGRNFEYQGEDPVLAGSMVGAMMKAEQDQGVVGDLKHYAMNDSENGRDHVNILASKRAMRESDLLAFEIALRDSGAGAFMCSYNLVNGDHACENDYLLNEVLKKDFGFKGFVISDWGATHSTEKAALAGLDMEQPGSGYFGNKLKEAVESGKVPVSRLDDMVHRILRTEFAVGLFDNPPRRQVPDIFKGFEVAQRTAEAGSVLLKNANGQLPLDASSLKSIAVIGSHADVGVLSGGGSAQVNPPGGNAVPPPPNTRVMDWTKEPPVWDPSSPLKAIRTAAMKAKVNYNDGTDAAAAAALAKSSDVAIVFANQPTHEGRDVPNLSLPGDQDALVEAVAAANPHTIVVLETGAAVTMPWIDKVSAVLEAWYPGIKGGKAIANILFGEVNPSGKLPVTFPKSEAQLPMPVLPTQPPPGQGDSKPIAPGVSYMVNTRQFTIDYSKESAMVGYKWYEAKNEQPLFPFGFGLSYTTFAFSKLHVTPGNSPTVTFAVKNTGARAGAEVAQVYAKLPGAAGESYKRLVGWEKVELAPGESKEVTVKIDPLYISIFNESKDGWELLPGEYKVMVGPSSAETPLNGSFAVGGN